MTGESGHGVPNDMGQFGDGSTTERCSPAEVSGITSAVAIAAENYSLSCLAAMADGTVRSWGTMAPDSWGDGDDHSRELRP